MTRFQFQPKQDPLFKMTRRLQLVNAALATVISVAALVPHAAEPKKYSIKDVELGAACEQASRALTRLTQDNYTLTGSCRDGWFIASWNSQDKDMGDTMHVALNQGRVMRVTKETWWRGAYMASATADAVVKSLEDAYGKTDPKAYRNDTPNAELTTGWPPVHYWEVRVWGGADQAGQMDSHVDAALQILPEMTNTQALTGRYVRAAHFTFNVGGQIDAQRRLKLVAEDADAVQASNDARLKANQERARSQSGNALKF
jgi:hypothetical protein